MGTNHSWQTPQRQSKFYGTGLVDTGKLQASNYRAERGKKLFDGTLLTVKYFLDALDMEIFKTLLYRGLDFEGDVLKYPQYLKEAYEAGRELVHALKE